MGAEVSGAEEHVPRIDGDRLWRSLMDMADVGGVPGGGSNRVALTDEDAAGQELFMRWAVEAGCDVARDRVGNVFATRGGSDAALPAVLVGSHLDTQPRGGRFDGTVGVLAGLEIVRTLNDRGVDTAASVVVVSWSNEEGARFPLPLTGSAVFAGLLAAEDAEGQRALDGPTYGEELKRLSLAGTDHGPSRVGAYFELHIEQNTTLERSGMDIGIVERGQGVRALEVRLSGASSHAGTTAMTERRDALLTAARIVEASNRVGHSTGTLVTVGRLDVSPNSRAVVPGAVKLVVDVRHPVSERLTRAVEEVTASVAQIAAADGIGVEIEQVLEIPVVTFDEGCGESIRQACRAHGLSFTSLVSGAGHDAMSIARVAPAALVFIPCRDGISHHPDEYATPAQAANGCNALLHAVLERAGNA